jgi:hypothetical protein
MQRSLFLHFQHLDVLTKISTFNSLLLHLIVEIPETRKKSQIRPYKDFDPNMNPLR